MEEDVRNYNNAPLAGLLGRGRNNDSTILFFLIVFLLLFTNFGCCGNN